MSSFKPPTSQEVQASPFLSALASDMAGGDSQTWAYVVNANRKLTTLNELKNRLALLDKELLDIEMQISLHRIKKSN